MESKPFLLGQLTRREFRARMSAGELKVCIIPTAAIEQHLEHLAMEHDWRSVNYIAKAVAKRLNPNVVIAQGLMAGISEHHMRHPGTISLRPGTFLSVLGDIIDSMLRAGFKNILVLNGHGGNIAACKSTWDQFLRQYPCNLQFLSYWDTLNKADAQDLLTCGHRIPEDLPGHAQEFETSVAMAAFPENVRDQVRGDQEDPTPVMATKETGAKIVLRVVERVTSVVTAMANGELVAECPPFHP